MILIEKKCPNCGASLKFNDDDKSCKCEYCKREFSIEKDKNSSIGINENYTLVDPSFGKVLSLTGGIASLIFTIICISIFFFILIVTYNLTNNTKNYSINSLISDDNGPLITNANKLTNQDIKNIDFNSKLMIPSMGSGENSLNHSYSIYGQKNKKCVIVASKNDSNKIISIYEVNYYDFFHKEDKYTVYIPVIYENVKSDVMLSLKNPRIPIHEYYFNEEKTSYVYGYHSFEEAYNDVVKPLSNDYEISQK